MVEERLTKKQLVPMIVGVLTMVFLIFGATYAYFSVTAGNSSGTTTITGDIGGDTLGTVTLTGGNTELYLGISADDMSETNKGKVYYSSTTEGSRETNVNSAGKTTYTATLTGDETDEVMYACDYEFTVTSSGTAIGQESINDIELVFNGDIEKTINLTGTDKVSGTWYGFKKSNAEREFNAYLKLTNTEVEQNDLAGTNLSVEIKNTKWKCYLSELDELVGDAYALVIKNGEVEDWDAGEMAPTYDLIFVRSEEPINVGDTYNGEKIVKAYTGFETEIYKSSTLPWKSEKGWFTNITFEDEIRPISISHWFDSIFESSYSEEKNYSINLEKLDVSKVTNMAGALAGLAGDGTVNILGIENWDVSNVTDMSTMFYADIVSQYFPDISNWDVSNVTDMSYMFCATSSNIINFNIGKWDTSNVTDMTRMFENAMILELSGIENLNTSSVLSMSGMFQYAYIEPDIDLSNWDVSNVKEYSDFSKDLYKGTIIPPIWPTTTN